MTEPTPEHTADSTAALGYQCCHCGGTGLDSYGDTCAHCEGLGSC
jgi:hypothetical protein